VSAPSTNILVGGSKKKKKRCEVNSLAETKEIHAHDALYMDVAAYFRQACSLDGNDKVIVTELAPIYFQHQGRAPAFPSLIMYELNRVAWSNTGMARALVDHYWVRNPR
jgi:hypothetical protein